MKRYYLTIILTVFSFIYSLSQETYTISGYIQETSSGENLIGASIFEQNSRKGTTSNQYGFYSLTLKQGEYTIIYSFIGMETIQLCRASL